MNSKGSIHKTAFNFVILLGLVSLFSDMVYEGARSVIGPYLGILGANASIVGFVAGFGELIGNGLRIFSGYLVDKTSRYWLIAFLGYFCNLITIPLLAIATTWQLAAALVILERVGKAIRMPARDTMLSYATYTMGRGKGFGLHQILDQIGAMLGPVMITIIFFLKNNYRLGFAFLAIPALLTLATLFITKKLHPHPKALEKTTPELKTKKMTKLFWIYLIGASLIALGYADFPLIAYHFQKDSVLTPIWIPIFYIFAMIMSSISTFFFGWIYDRIGCIILIIAVLISITYVPLTFLGGFSISLLGMILWGIGMGAQKSLLKAILGNMTAKEIRGSAYGIFNAGYGIFWFLGSWVMGMLYDVSIDSLIIFSILAQLASIPFIYYVYKKSL